LPKSARGRRLNLRFKSQPPGAGIQHRHSVQRSYIAIPACSDLRGEQRQLPGHYAQHFPFPAPLAVHFFIYYEPGAIQVNVQYTFTLFQAHTVAEDNRRAAVNTYLQTDNAVGTRDHRFNFIDPA